MRLPDDSEIIIELEGTHPIPRPLTPVSPASFASPENVGDRVFVEHVMPKLDLNISSEPLSDWFQLGILNSRSGSHILSGNGSRVGSESGTSIVETSAGSQDNVGPSQSEESAVIKPALSATSSFMNLEGMSNSSQSNLVRSLPAHKKLVPAPIKIPKASLRPKIQIQHLSTSTSQTARRQSRPKSRPDSPVSADSTSALSGSSLARALIANTFVLSDDSGHGAHMTRQDSATLPLGDHFSKSPYWRDKSSSSELNVSSTSGRESPIFASPSAPFGVDRSSTGPKGSRSSRRFRESPEKQRRNRLQITTARLENRFPEPNQRARSISQERSVSQLISTAFVRDNAQALSQILEGSSSARSSTGTPGPFEAREITAPKRPSPALSPLGAVSSGASIDDSPSPPATSESEMQFSHDIQTSRPTEQPLASPPGSAPSIQSTETAVGGYPHVSLAKRKGPRFSSSSRGSTSSSTSSSSRSTRKQDSRAHIRKVHATVPAQGRPEWSIPARRVGKPKVNPATLLPIGGRKDSISHPLMASSSSENLRHPILSLAPSKSLSRSSSVPLFRLNTAGIGTASTFSLNRQPSPTQSAYARQRVGSPNSFAVARDSNDISSYKITVIPDSELEDMSQMTSASTDEGYQTFPETPDVFSPTFSSATHRSLLRSASTSHMSRQSSQVALLSSTRSGGAYSPSQHFSLSRAFTSVSRVQPDGMRHRWHPYAVAALSDHEEEDTCSDIGPPTPKGADFSGKVKSIPAVLSPTLSTPLASAQQYYPDQIPHDTSSISEYSANSTDVAPSISERSQLATPLLSSLSAPGPILRRPPQQVENTCSVGGNSSSGDNAQIASLGRDFLNGLRSRPPLPVGPRGLTAQSGTDPTANVQQDCGSVPSAAHSIPNVSHIPIRRHELPSISPPKFKIPPPQWHGYSMEVAQWTFSSAELQNIVSKVIRQSADASSLRLLPLATLDADIPEELRRLETLETDLKARYQFEARRRSTILSLLSAQIHGSELVDSSVTLRTLDELVDISKTLDHVTEELYSVDHQISHLQSLRDVHSASALAVALRKLNNSFLKQVAENRALRSKIESLEAERDEAWKQAEDIATEFDDLNDRILETYGDIGWAKPANRRSSQVLAVRRSSARASKAGLRSHRSSSTSTPRISSAGSMVAAFPGVQSTSSASEIPPVPPIPIHSPREKTEDLPSPSSGATFGSPITFSPSGDARALADAQQELYDMLGIPTAGRLSAQSRPRSLSGPSGLPVKRTSTRSPFLNQRPLSDVSPGSPSLGP